jgi:septum formation protein
MSRSNGKDTATGSDDTLILASASPRRRQLLGMLGLQFRIMPSQIEEAAVEGEDPRAYAVRTACSKALDIARSEAQPPVLGADTVVELEGRILGKPWSPENAIEMLGRLSGRTHRVHTALALVHQGRCVDLVDTATVHLEDLDEEIIRWYVETGEPLDKAGAYAIQGVAGAFVSGIEGSPHTVVGLPLHRLPGLFAAHDLDFWSCVTTDSSQ